MSFICKNGREHRHESVAEARRCWFPERYTSPMPPAPFAASRPSYSPPMAPPVRLSSSNQVKYIGDLGGDTVYAATLTFEQASQYIDRLKAEARTRRQSRVADTRLDLIKGMIDMIPEGYYASAPQGEGGHVDFIRISRPTKGQYRNSTKIQTQHSDLWDIALVLWPSGNWTVKRWSAVETLMLVIADYKTCAQRYAIEVQSCMRCNKTLTDDRSRHYLVGPECETKHGFTWPIDYANEQNAGLSFEQLVARGLPTRVWQERALAR